jgi:hypothetical protein
MVSAAGPLGRNLGFLGREMEATLNLTSWNHVW